MDRRFEAVELARRRAAWPIRPPPIPLLRLQKVKTARTTLAGVQSILNRFPITLETSSTW